MKVIILGGGLSGLAAGYRLSKAGNEVTILEKEDYLGGLASSYAISWGGKNYWLTKTYHHILHGDETTINTIKELNLESKLNRKKVKTGFEQIDPNDKSHGVKPDESMEAIIRKNQKEE